MTANDAGGTTSGDGSIVFGSSSSIASFNGDVVLNVTGGTGAITDAKVSTSGTGKITLSNTGSGGITIGSLGLIGRIGAEDVTITTGGAVSQTGAITASLLTLVGGTFDLNDANNVVMALDANNTTLGGDLTFRNDAAFDVAGIDVGANDVELQSTSAVSQSAGITANGLSLIGAGGDYTLTNAANAITTLAGNTGSVSFNGDSGYAIGLVTVTGGTTTTGLMTTGNTTLSSKGTVTQSQAIGATGLELLGAGGTYTLLNGGNVATTLAANTGTVSYSDTDGLIVGTVNATNGVNATVGNVVIDFNQAGLVANTIAIDRAITAEGTSTINGGAAVDTFDFADGLSVDNVSGAGASDILDLADHTGNLSWNINAANGGTVTGMTFSSVENLTSGSDMDDFTVQNTFGVNGTIDGQGGNDTLDLSAYTTNVAVTLTGPGASDGFAGTATSITGTWVRKSIKRK